jgi:pyruvate formate lyase activating enzyme
VEIVTLVVTDFNDSEAELRDIARFIKGVSPDIPWHVTAFHGDYRMANRDDTDARRITHAAELGYEEGLHYVYAGNRPGSVGRYEHTWCPRCGKMLVERAGFHVLRNNLAAGACPQCGAKIAGIWNMEDVAAARQRQRREMSRPDIAAVVASARSKFAEAK